MIGRQRFEVLALCWVESALLQKRTPPLRSEQHLCHPDNQNVASGTDSEAAGLDLKGA
jgi:hypothetical protein